MGNPLTVAKEKNIVADQKGLREKPGVPNDLVRKSAKHCHNTARKLEEEEDSYRSHKRESVFLTFRDKGLAEEKSLITEVSGGCMPSAGVNY